MLDFMTVGTLLPHHYAFTVSPADFDAAYGRVRARCLTTYAQPDRSGEREIYRRGDGRRGLYSDDPDRNLMN